MKALRPLRVLVLVQKGLIEPQEAYFKAPSKPEFKALLDRHHIKIEGV